MGKSQASVKEFAFIGFMLLAVLFGMQIMVFVFGSLNVVNTGIEDVSATINNETGGYVNISGYTIAAASNTNFTGFSVIEILANGTGLTGAFLIPAANYTINSVTGVITNATEVTDAIAYDDANISYTYTRKSTAEVIGEGVSNDSLQAIGNYATQAGTQFTTLGIAITLVVLVAVFLFFWAAFMGGGRKGSSRGGGSVAAGEGMFG